MEAQGYKVSDNIVYQDNERAIRIEASDMTVKYCRTVMMIGDFYTKALQEKAFKTFKDLIMNVNR
eukprot:3118150-Ditylum_brightwellii.AAC.1